MKLYISQDHFKRLGRKHVCMHLLKQKKKPYKEKQNEEEKKKLKVKNLTVKEEERQKIKNTKKEHGLVGLGFRAYQLL